MSVTFDEPIIPRAGAAGRPPRPSPAPQPEPQASAAPTASEHTTAPVGAGGYVVKPGDCMTSIAKASGHFWEKIWNDPGNSALKTARLDPNVLLPDDRVVIPPLTRKAEPGQTEMRHRFVRKGEPSMLRLQVLNNDKPVANQPYELRVDQLVYAGSTDPEGKLQAAIPGTARRGYLTVGTEPNRLQYVLNLGEVEPIESLKGVQQRLRNLGYGVPVDGSYGPQVEAALRGFQKNCGLTQTGRADDQTRQTLKQKHGC